MDHSNTPQPPATHGKDSVQERCTLTNAERFVLREVRDAYADVDDVRCNEIAAVIDGLLERALLRDEVERLRLTASEQAAIRRAAAVADEFHDLRLAATLRSMLDRTKPADA